jgi:hypothetical protein
MKSKKASALLTILTLVVAVGFLASIGYLINDQIGDKDIDEEDSDTQQQLALQSALLGQQDSDQTTTIPSATFGSDVSDSNNDNDEPDEVDNLRDTSRGTTWIYWDWDNPDDDDFDDNLVYLDGVKVATTSSSYYNATDLTPGTQYTISVKTRDYDGNVNEDSVSDSATTLGLASDTTAPASVTSLASTAVTINSISWNWTNPTDADFTTNIVYINNAFHTNTTNNYLDLTGLTANTNYTINVHTADASGNVNTTDVTNIATTNADTTIPGPITGLQLQRDDENPQLKDLNSLTWNWTNPTDADFAFAIVELDGANVANTTNSYYTAEGLARQSTHTISITTIDTSNNINPTAVNNTAQTCYIVTWFEDYIVCD